MCIQTERQIHSCVSRWKYKVDNTFAARVKFNQAATVVSEDQMSPVQFKNTEDDFLMIQLSIFILGSWGFCLLHLICAFCEGKKKPKPQQNPQNSLETSITQSF